MAEGKRQVNTSVETEVYDAIKREAEAEDRTFSAQVARILRTHVREKDAAVKIPQEKVEDPGQPF